ncbi:MAG TPA: cytochrome c oxidase subunit II [Bacteroidia bacterium]|nr:cytochrome c oxidase subunit II [Bacteroidia bacterium]
MIKFLVYIAGALALILVFQLMRIYQLSAEVKGKNTGLANEKDNLKQGRGALLFVIGFFVFLFWMIFKYKNMILPVAASDVGKTSDTLFAFNWLIVFVVGIATEIMLFYFTFKYRKHKENTKAFFYPHNDKLELIWTVVPSIALAVIIIYGLSLWGKMTGPAEKDATVIQLYAKQFDFTARYAGKDNQLGKSNYKLIDDATNPLGMDSTDANGMDDIIVKSELHLLVNKPVLFYCNAREVMHGMYFPHFREQINCVPGITTSMHFIPTITTAEMRKITKDTAFDYLLLCNRVCGGGHYGMQMKVVVDDQASYDAWMAKQKPFYAGHTAPAPAASAPTAMK